MARGRSALGPSPEVVTLLEALESAEPRPTLVWGRGIAAVVRQLNRSADVYALLPDTTAARGIPQPAHVGIRPEGGAVERVVMLLPRSRDELKWRLEVARSLLDEDQELWLAGHQQDGVKSTAKLLKEMFGPTSVVRTKRHTRVLMATCRAPMSISPDPTAKVLRWKVRRGDAEVECASFPGTFSHGRLDEGTDHLLGVLAGMEAPRRALDLGAGCGVIGAWLLARNPDTRVTMVEHSAAAFWSIGETLRQSGLQDDERAELILGRAEDAPDQRYDVIVTNPPFHVGRHQERTQAEAFATVAAQRLSSTGVFLMVANRHLGYAEPLSDRFEEVDVAWEDGRFRVWRARGARG